MGLDIAEGVDRFEAYLTGLTSVIGHEGRTAPLHDYCLGLLATDGRKSVEPMAATTAPAKVSVQHQKMLHFVSNSPWSDQAVLTKSREMVLPEIERHLPYAVSKAAVEHECLKSAYPVGCQSDASVIMEGDGPPRLSDDSSRVSAGFPG